MHKTLLKKLTVKKLTYSAHAPLAGDADAQLAILLQEMKGYLDEAATDLLQPRSEAIQRILTLARSTN